MRRAATALACASALLLGGWTVVSAETVRYVVLYNASSLPASVDRDVATAGGQVVRKLPQVGVAVVTSARAGFATAMRTRAGVFSVGSAPAEALPDGAATPEASGPTAADTYYNVGWQWGTNRVNAPVAWAAGVSGSHSTVVAVIDTGVAWNHPDLAPNVLFAACVASTPTCNPYPSLSWHGTHVAGTIAAAFGAGGVVGVGPNLGLASYNTFEFIPGCGVCSYADSRWVAMIDAADRGFEVINMSLGSTAQYGGRGTNDLAAFVAAEKRVATYVLKKGTNMVAASGNSGLDLNGTIINLPSDIPEIVGVSATGIRPDPVYPQPGAWDVLADYSNYGAAVTVAAPGGECGPNGPLPTGYCPGVPTYPLYLILSTYVFLNPTCAAAANCPAGYAWAGGTSMASPHAAGVLGLIRNSFPNLSARQAMTRLKQTAEDLGDRQAFGHGMADAAAAIP